jgi:transposase InsO family protein
MKFIFEWQRRFDAAQGRVDVAELCRMYGVSRQTGYVWIRRYRAAGYDIRAMEEQSRRPKTNPRATDLAIEDAIIAARKAHPKWGPRLLRQWLVDRNPRVSFPGASCVATILKRRGMTTPRKQRRSAGTRPVVTPPFAECVSPNTTWCMDFKGWIRTGDREKCHPFTLLDAYSRFLLRCEALLEPNGDEVRSILDSAFREYGLPTAIRSDGGPPFFASNGAATIGRVAVWLLRLGIVLECIAPGKPQQNGKLERFHKTLNLELQIGEDIVEQQRLCDVFRRQYNHERPHTSLGLQTPGRVYRRSTKRYPRRPLPGDVGGLHSERVDQRGKIAWRRQRVYIGEAFAGEWLTLWPGERDTWELYFGAVALGVLDDSTGAARFRPARRPKKSTMRLAYLGE